MRVRVGFSKGRSLVGRIICAVTGAGISHTFFLVEDGDESWAYEAVPGPRGFRRLSWVVYQRHNEVRDLVDASWPHEEVKEVLDSMLGTRYSLRRFFMVGLALLLHRPVSDPGDAFDCVTSVLRITTRFGMSTIGRPLTPAELRVKMGT
jgi:hypothetical protein